MASLARYLGDLDKVSRLLVQVTREVRPMRIGERCFRILGGLLVLEEGRIHSFVANNGCLSPNGPRTHPMMAFRVHQKKKKKTGLVAVTKFYTGKYSRSIQAELTSVCWLVLHELSNLRIQQLSIDPLFWFSTVSLLHWHWNFHSCYSSSPTWAARSRSTTCQNVLVNLCRR